MKRIITMAATALASLSLFATWTLQDNILSDGNWSLTVTASGTSLTLTGITAGSGVLDLTGVEADTGCKVEYVKPAKVNNSNGKNLFGLDYSATSELSLAFTGFVAPDVLELQSWGGNGSAFSNCGNLETVTLPKLQKIDAGRTFYKCAKWAGDFERDMPNLTYLNGANVFEGSGLVRVGSVAEQLTACSGFNGAQLLDDDLVLTSLVGSDCPNLNTCKKVRSVTLSASVTSIKNQIFQSCDSLQTVTCHGNLATVGTWNWNGKNNHPTLVLYGTTVPSVSASSNGSKDIVCQVKNAEAESAWLTAGAAYAEKLAAGKAAGTYDAKCFALVPFTGSDTLFLEAIQGWSGAPWAEFGGVTGDEAGATFSGTGGAGTKIWISLAPHGETLPESSLLTTCTAEETWSGVVAELSDGVDYDYALFFQAASGGELSPMANASGEFHYGAYPLTITCEKGLSVETVRSGYDTVTLTVTAGDGADPFICWAGDIPDGVDVTSPSITFRADCVRNIVAKNTIPWAYDAAAGTLAKGGWSLTVTASGTSLTLTGITAGSGVLDLTGVEADTGCKVEYVKPAKVNNSNGKNLFGLNYNDTPSDLQNGLKGFVAPDVLELQSWGGNGSAFSNCGNLETVTLPRLTKTDGNRTFINCAKWAGDLERDMPNLTSLSGTGVFQGSGLVRVGGVAEQLTACSGFNGAKSLDDDLVLTAYTGTACPDLSNCTKVRSVTLSSSVVTIGNQYLQNCESLQMVTCQGNLATVGTWNWNNGKCHPTLVLYGTTVPAVNASYNGSKDIVCLIKNVEARAAWLAAGESYADKLAVGKAAGTYDAKCFALVPFTGSATLFLEAIADWPEEAWATMEGEVACTADGATFAGGASEDAKIYLAMAPQGVELPEPTQVATGDADNEWSFCAPNLVAHTTYAYRLAYTGPAGGELQTIATGAFLYGAHDVKTNAGRGGTAEVVYSGFDTATVTAKPDDGCSFFKWTGDVPDGVDVREATISFKADREYELTAKFLTAWDLDADNVLLSNGNWSLSVTCQESSLTLTQILEGEGDLDLTDVEADTGCKVEYLKSANGKNLYGLEWNVLSEASQAITGFVAPDLLEIQSKGGGDSCSGFANCPNLAAVTLPKLTTINPPKAFYNCAKWVGDLERDMPALKVLTKGDVFQNSGLVKVGTVAGQLTTCGGFSGAKSLSGDLSFPSLATQTSAPGLSYSAVTSVVYPACVTTVPNQTLQTCDSLKSVTFQGDVASIGTWNSNSAQIDAFGFYFEGVTVPTVSGTSNKPYVRLYVRNPKALPVWQEACRPNADAAEVATTNSAAKWPGRKTIGLLKASDADGVYFWVVDAAKRGLQIIIR